MCIVARRCITLHRRRCGSEVGKAAEPCASSHWYTRTTSQPSVRSSSTVERGSPWSSSSRFTRRPEEGSDRRDCAPRTLTPVQYPHPRAPGTPSSAQPGPGTGRQPQQRDAQSSSSLEYRVAHSSTAVPLESWPVTTRRIGLDMFVLLTQRTTRWELTSPPPDALINGAAAGGASDGANRPASMSKKRKPCQLAEPRQPSSSTRGSGIPRRVSASRALLGPSESGRRENGSLFGKSKMGFLLGHVPGARSGAEHGWHSIHLLQVRFRHGIPHS
jgi:hypothetical protein